MEKTEKCKHHYTKSIDNRLTDFCKLKESNDIIKYKICDYFAQNELGGSFINPNCPVARENLWPKCPFMDKKI